MRPGAARAYMVGNRDEAVPAKAPAMTQLAPDLTPETVYVDSANVACDGGPNPALGHPRVFYTIAQEGYVDCGYCDRRFILAGGPADRRGNAA